MMTYLTTEHARLLMMTYRNPPLLADYVNCRDSGHHVARVRRFPCGPAQWRCLTPGCERQLQQDAQAVPADDLARARSRQA